MEQTASRGPVEETVGIVEIEIPSSLEFVTVVRMLVAAAAVAEGGLGGDRLDDLKWVTSEAVTNAIQANQAKAEEEERKPGRVSMSCEVGGEAVHLVVCDEGSGIPEQLEVPEMGHPDRLYLEGGFGVPLMRKLSKGEMSFESSSEGTILRIAVRQG